MKKVIYALTLALLTPCWLAANEHKEPEKKEAKEEHGKEEHGKEGKEGKEGEGKSKGKKGDNGEAVPHSGETRQTAFDATRMGDDDEGKEHAETVGAFIKLGHKASANGEFAQAQEFFEKALGKPVTLEEKRDALAGLAELVDEKLHQATKAATIYEQFCKLFPADADVPRYTLRLGKLYRELGAFNSAINKLYSVLNASLRYGDSDVYRNLVQQAQFEIAETYFASGDYTKAASFFERLVRLDLPEEEKTIAEFKRADILFRSGDYPAALNAAQRFVPAHSGHSLTAEAQYIVIRSLRALHRDEDALMETLRILRAGKDAGKDQPELWAYWRQRTGNDLANDLYAKSDIPHALTVYQALAELSEKPAWRWPAVYQIGLCFERLRQPERAAQAYQYLLKQPEPGTVADAATKPEAPTAKGAAKDEHSPAAAEKKDEHGTTVEKKDEEHGEKADEHGEKPEAAKTETVAKIEAKAAPAGKTPSLGEFSNLKLLREMAQWRADHLKWVGNLEAELSQLTLPRNEPPKSPDLRTPVALRGPEGAEPATPTAAPGLAPKLKTAPVAAH